MKNSDLLALNEAVAASLSGRVTGKLMIKLARYKQSILSDIAAIRDVEKELQDRHITKDDHGNRVQARLPDGTLAERNGAPLFALTDPSAYTKDVEDLYNGESPAPRLALSEEELGEIAEKGGTRVTGEIILILLDYVATERAGL